MREGRIIDISPPISPKSEVWPGDTPFSSRRVMDKGEGCSCNVTTITTTVHVGAHLDAPLHFADGGRDVASVSLDACVGPVRVVRLLRKAGITREDVSALDLLGVERLLVHTRKDRAPARFADGFAYLEPEAARLLSQRGLRLFGIDTFSVDHPESKELLSHHALLSGGCAILEGLDLSGVAAGDYELMALPLKMVGVDASPVRAVLRELPEMGAKRGLPRRALRRLGKMDDEGGRDGGAGMDTMRAPNEDTLNLNYLLTTLELKTGDVATVQLDAPANVMLIDDKNLAAYVSGKEFEYFGGWASASPVELSPPRPGRWNVIIDTGDADTAVSAAIRVGRG